MPRNEQRRPPGGKVRTRLRVIPRLYKQARNDGQEIARRQGKPRSGSLVEPLTTSLLLLKHKAGFRFDGFLGRGCLCGFVGFRIQSVSLGGEGWRARCS